MAKRALIAEPDVDEARKQAAILQDDGYQVKTFQDGELFDELDEYKPDVILLRHERPGQNGLALLTRLKTHARFADIAVVITTSELEPDSIDEHRAQENPADAYVRLPAERQDLVDAARSLPVVPEPPPLDEFGPGDDDDDVPAPPDLTAPPPLPPMRPPTLRSGRHARPTSQAKILTPKDLAYVEDIFSSIQGVEGDASRPAQPDLPTAGPDRKLGLLRAKLREYEYKMGRLKVLWRGREEELGAREDAIEQERIEIDGLRLRISELEKEVEETKAEMAAREKQHGQQVSEQYDDAALREAQALNQLAAQQYETEKLKNKLRTAEEEKDGLQKQLTEQILDWERAYKQFEAHHWAVVQASHNELVRLEVQLRDREQRSSSMRTELKYTESSLGLERSRHAETREALFRAETGRAAERTFVEQAWDKHWRAERAARVAADDELRILRPRTLELEDALHRHDRLLRYLDDQRVQQLAQVVGAHQESERERRLLEARFDDVDTRARQLEATLDVERAYGEAAYAKLAADYERAEIIAGAQETYFARELERAQSTQGEGQVELERAQQRLAVEEANHTEQRQRADDLEAFLGEDRERQSQERAKIMEELAGVVADRERLDGALNEAESALADTREALGAAREQHDEALRAHADVLEENAAENKGLEDRIGVLERDLGDAREDMANLQRTVGARDERIAELQARVRENDEAVIQLESMRDRLELQLAEHRASFEAQAEREADLMDRLADRDQSVSETRQVRSDLESQLRASEAQEKQLRAEHAEVERQLAEEREALSGARTQVDQMDDALEEERQRATRIAIDLENARAEILVGAGMTDELQAQLDGWHERVEEHRAREASLEDRIGSLTQELVEAGDAKEDLQRDLSESQSQVDSLVADLREARGALSSATQATESLSAEADARASELSASAASELSSLRAQLEAQRAEFTQQQRSAAAELDEVREESARFSAAAEQLRTQLEATTTSDEVAALRASAAETQASLEAQLANEREARERAEASAGEATGASAEELAATRDQLAAAQQALASAQSQIESSSDAVAQLVATREALTQTQQALEEARAQALSTQQALEQTQASAAPMADPADVEARAAAEKSAADAQQQVAELEGWLERAVNEKSEIVTQLEHAQAELQQARAEAGGDADVAWVQGELDAARGAMEALRNERDAAMQAAQKLKAALQEAQQQQAGGEGPSAARVAQLEEMLSRLSSAYDAARKQVNELRIQLEKRSQPAPEQRS